jgi:hypothetical protein
MAFLPISSPTVFALLVKASAAPLAAYPVPAPIPPARAPVRIAVPKPSVTSLPSDKLVRTFPAPPLTDPPTVPAPMVIAT